MEKYKLANKLNEKIVDGLMKGYEEYIDVRREKFSTMRISGAYAWVKGNHIDDKVAEVCTDENVDFKLSKAGVSWQYLQFRQERDKVLFIIRNARYFNENEVSKGTDIHGQTVNRKKQYLEGLMNINSDIDFGHIENQTTSRFKTIQLELSDLFVDEKESRAIKQLESKFERFYIITYTIDEAHNISKISLYMPNPVNNKAYLIEDLTVYIKADQISQVDEETREILVAGASSDDFGYGIEIVEEDIEKNS